MAKYEFLANAHQLLPGQARQLTVAGRGVALFNLDGRFFALDGACPHRGGPLGCGHVENGRVYCPMHGWSFEIVSGACLEHPGKGVQCLPLRLVEGGIEIWLDSEPPPAN